MADAEGLESAIQRHEALMERMMVLMKAHIGEFCRAQDLTPPQLWALQNIEGMGTLKVSPLAACLGLSMGATSTLVDRLVSRELVTRTPDPDDRRAVFVGLTDKGAQAVAMVRQSRRALFTAVLGSMTAQERDTLLDGMERMMRGIERFAAVDPKALAMGLGGCGMAPEVDAP